MGTMSEIQRRASGGVVVLDVAGEILQSDGESIQRLVQELLEEGRDRLLLNLEAVPYIDSAGLGEILVAKKAALIAGAQLKVLKPQKQVFGLLAQMNLTRIFECFEDEGQALASFRASSNGP
jgi:anti-sigma B factor antagonist